MDEPKFNFKIRFHPLGLILLTNLITREQVLQLDCHISSWIFNFVSYTFRSITITHNCFNGIK